MNSFVRIIALGLVASLVSCATRAGGRPLLPARPPHLSMLDGKQAGLTLPKDPRDPDIEATGTPLHPGTMLKLPTPELRDVYKRIVGSVVLVATARIEDDGTVVPLGHGSGFIVSRDGFVVTNRHVIEGAGAIVVILKDPSRRVSRIDEAYQERFGRMAVLVAVATEDRDLALLKILNPPADLTVATFAAADDVEVLQNVIAIGHPADFQFSPTEAPMSLWDVAPGAIRNIQEKAAYRMLIRHSAPLNAGNSGGPLFDHAGRVVGVNTMKPIEEEPRERKFEGVFWSIGVTDVRNFLDAHRQAMSTGGPLPAETAEVTAGETRLWHLGLLGAGHTAKTRMKYARTEGVPELVLGYDNPLLLVTKQAGSWMLKEPAPGGWLEIGAVEFDARQWHTFEFSRTATEFTLSIDGKVVRRETAGLPARGWAFLALHGFDATLERP